MKSRHICHYATTEGLPPPLVRCFHTNSVITKAFYKGLLPLCNGLTEGIGLTKAKAVCPNPKGYVMTVIDGELITKPAPCNEPDCPVCGKKIRRDIIQRLDKGFRGYRNRMLTLTQRPGHKYSIGKAASRFKAYLSRPRLSARDHQKHLDWLYYGQHRGERRPRLRKRAPLRRQRTFWMKEPHPGPGPNHGELHIHMAVSVFIPKGILDAAWRYATDGYGEFTYAKAGKKEAGAEDIIRVGRYMSKYITKTLAEFHDTSFKKGERRYSFTHHPEFKKERFRPAEKWKFVMNRDAHTWGLPNLELAGARSLIQTSCEVWPVLHDLRDPWPGDPPGRVRELAQEVYSKITERQAIVY